MLLCVDFRPLWLNPVHQLLEAIHMIILYHTRGDSCKKLLFAVYFRLSYHILSEKKGFYKIFLLHAGGKTIDASKHKLQLNGSEAVKRREEMVQP